MPPPPPQLGLNADVTTEILLRLPPGEPEHLFRAALVCKPWLRVVCGPDFRRRYRTHHGTPPLLGLLHMLQGDPAPLLLPTTAAPLCPYPTRARTVLDCRHGRALLQAVDGGGGWHFLVWNPVTGDQRRLPDTSIPLMLYTAAVLCAADGCDHLDCPFRVFFAGIHHNSKKVMATVYSSEMGAWSTPASLGVLIAPSIMRIMSKRCALIGDDIYFTLWCTNGIVKYSCGNNCLSMIDPPSHRANNIALMVMDDTSLVFAYIQASYLYLWSRKVNSERDAEWVQCRKVEGLIPVVRPDDEPFVAGFAEGVGVIFISSGAGLFALELKSESVRKVAEPGVYFSILPYMSFYTPDRGTLLSLARTHWYLMW